MAANKTIEMWALHAYADGELEAHERVEMERVLEEDVEARGVLDAIRREKAGLHVAFDRVLEEPVPFGITKAARNFQQTGFSVRRAVAAALVFLALGAGSGWLGAGWLAPQVVPDLAQRALVAHEVYTTDQRHPVEVLAAERVHLQGWLSKRIGSEIAIPTLDFHGYQLLGGRLLAGETSPAGQLMYEGLDKRRLTVFIGANAAGKEEALRWSVKDGLVTCYWNEGKLAIAVTGDMDKKTMKELADDIYKQLDLG